MTLISGGPKNSAVRSLDTKPTTTTTTTETKDTAPAEKKGWTAKVQDKAKEAVLKEVQKDRDVVGINKSVSVGGTSFSVAGKVKEQVVLDKKHPLIAGNADRAASTDVVWTKLTTEGSAGAGVSAPLTGGVGASFGFSKGIQMSAIVPADRSLSKDNLVDTLKDQKQVLTMNMHPDKITNYAPGTQFTIAEQPENYSLGVGVGFNSQVGVENISAGLSASTSLQKDAYTKSVTVEKDGVVAVRIGTSDSVSASVNFGLNAEADLPGGKLVENQVKITANASASAGARKSLDIGARFDLKTEEGRQAYEYVMGLDPRALETNPLAAQGILRQLGVGATYSSVSANAGVNANIKLGKFEALNFSSGSRTTEGVLWEVKDGDGKVLESTKLSEAEYNRKVGGFFPRLVVGEERDVAVRMGSVTKNGGAEERAALLSLNVKDPKVTAEDHQQNANFASQFGIQGKAPTKFDGKGTFQTQMAITEAGLKKLDAQPKEMLEVRFEKAMEAVQGQTVPWKNETTSQRNPSYRVEQYNDPPAVKERFATALKEWTDVQTFGDDESNKRDRLLTDYSLTTGRSFERDVASFQAMKDFANEIDRTRNRPVSERSSMLSTLGKMSSGDMKTSLVALKDAADGSLVSMAYDANGVSLKSDTKTAPPTIGQIADTALNR